MQHPQEIHSLLRRLSKLSGSLFLFQLCRIAQIREEVSSLKSERNILKLQLKNQHLLKDLQLIVSHIPPGDVDILVEGPVAPGYDDAMERLAQNPRQQRLLSHMAEKAAREGNLDEVLRIRSLIPTAKYDASIFSEFLEKGHFDKAVEFAEQMNLPPTCIVNQLLFHGGASHAIAFADTLENPTEILRLAVRTLSPEIARRALIHFDKLPTLQAELRAALPPVRPNPMDDLLTSLGL